MEAGYQVHLANTAAMQQKVFSLQNLYAAFKHGKKNKGKAGLDRVSIKQFEGDLENKRPKYSQGLNGWVLNSIENMLQADVMEYGILYICDISTHRQGSK